MTEHPLRLNREEEIRQIIEKIRKLQEDLKTTTRVIDFKIRKGQEKSLPTKLRRKDSLTKKIQRLMDRLSILHGNPEEEE